LLFFPGYFALGAFHSASSFRSQSSIRFFSLFSAFALRDVQVRVLERREEVLVRVIEGVGVEDGVVDRG
jgi:hypothetical protein